MANAALVIDNLADDGSVIASSQALTMPASNLLTPHPSERWRSTSNAAYVVLDKGSSLMGDTGALFGLTCGPNATIRWRASSIDSTGAAGDVFDSGVVADGDPRFDVSYASFIAQLPAPAAWRYSRFDLSDPDATFVEAGCILDGLSEAFVYNFVPGATFQHTDRSRISKAASGKTLVWDDDVFRTVVLSFDFINETQRYGVFERLDRVKGRKVNVLLMTDTASPNLPRDSIFGLVPAQNPIAYGPVFSIFTKQISIEERI